jgi:GLPGLI family protein
MKIKHLLIALFYVSVINAQTEDSKKHKILKVTYTAYPMSTYDTPPDDSNLSKSHSGIVALAQGYQHMYTLYVDLKTNQSLYKLDTLIINKPSGKEQFNYQINQNLDYVLKDQSNKYSKHEKIFQREFFSVGSLSSIEWNITDDTKEISGLKCRKAVPKNKDFLLNVWFTEDINVSSGPVNYFGLPGLVVWSEDFFWTTEINSISYEDNYDLKSEFINLKEKFDKNKSGKLITEEILIEKKNKLVKSMIKQMQR